MCTAAIFIFLFFLVQLKYLGKCTALARTKMIRLKIHLQHKNLDRSSLKRTGIVYFYYIVIAVIGVFLITCIPVYFYTAKTVITLSVAVRQLLYLDRFRQLLDPTAVSSFAKCTRMDLRRSTLHCSWTTRSTPAHKSLSLSRRDLVGRRRSG